MKYIPGALGSDFRGRIGGIVGSKNSSCNFLRKLNVPYDPWSEVQSSKRNNFYQVSKYWAGISSENKVLWSTFASGVPFYNSLRQMYYLTAFQMFMYCNLNLTQNGFTLTEIPASVGAITFPDLTGSSVDIFDTPGAESIKLFIPAAPIAPNVIIVMATPVISAGVAHPKGFRFITSCDSTFISGASIMTQYIAKFGAIPSAGEIAWFKIYYIDSTYGMKGLPIQFSATGTI